MDKNTSSSFKRRTLEKIASSRCEFKYIRKKKGKTKKKKDKNRFSSRKHKRSLIRREIKMVQRSRELILRLRLIIHHDFPFNLETYDGD